MSMCFEKLFSIRGRMFGNGLSKRIDSDPLSRSSVNLGVNDVLSENVSKNLERCIELCFNARQGLIGSGVILF